MLITANLQDMIGIVSAYAEIENEEGYDKAKFFLAEGTTQKGTWKADWVAHATKNQKWYNLTIKATNLFGKTAVFDTKYFDPVQNHSASEVTAGTFDSGNFVFPNNLTINGRLSSLDNDMAINNILTMFTVSNASGLSYRRMKNGMVDAFQDQTGINTGASANQSFTTGYYQPYTSAYGPDILTGGTAISSGDTGSFTAEKAVDNSEVVTDRWTSDNTAQTHWWKYDLGAGVTKTVKQLHILPWIEENDGHLSCKDFTLQGSNNDADWTTIDTQQFTDTSGWRTYNAFSNSIAYRYYRLSFTSTWASTVRNGVIEVEMMELGTPTYNNMALISNSYKAQTTPTKARITLFEEDVNAITINTDLKGYVSRDNGTSWTQVTLTDEGNWSTNKRILSGTADISSQPSNTLMKWNVTTFNSKNLKLHGVGMLWE